MKKTVPTEERIEQRTEKPTILPVRWGYVLLLALPLIILNGWWIANSEMKTGVTEVTISTLFMGVTFVLFVLTLLNLLVKRIGNGSAALHQPELMALYTMLSISSVVSGVGHFGFFTPFLSNAFHYANDSNDWKGFWYLLPDAIGPRDPAILKGMYEGHSTFFQPAIMRAWFRPLAIWSGFFLVLLWTTLCLSSILRRRWADEERLSFPVLALPLEMTREGAPIYKNRLLWIGFAIPFVLHSINSLQSMYPALPSYPVTSLHDFLWDGNLQFPLNAVGSFFYLVHPSGIGFGYLVNTDVSFSLWFLYVFKKLILVLSAAFGWRKTSLGWGAEADGQFPYYNFQGCGAWIMLGIAAFWSGRHTFSACIDRALEGDKHGVDRNEAMSARVAVFGFVAGFLAMCALVWSWGGSWWLPVLFLSIYLLMMISLSRVRAEMAVVCTELVCVNPQTILTTTLGTNGMSHLDLAHTATLSWFNTDYRAVGMPHELEGIVGMDRAKGKLKPLVGAILLAAAVAMVSSLIWDLQLYYTNGGETGFVNQWRISKGSEPWNNLSNWLHNAKSPKSPELIAMVFGGAMTLVLTALRSRFIDFPLQPAAYALNMTFANDFFWCDMFVAWGIKTLALRYGGMKLYRQAMPFFLGMILGDFVTGSAWSIFGSVCNLELFRTFAI